MLAEKFSVQATAPTFLSLPFSPTFRLSSYFSQSSKSKSPTLYVTSTATPLASLSSVATHGLIAPWDYATWTWEGTWGSTGLPSRSCPSWWPFSAHWEWVLPFWPFVYLRTRPILPWSRASYSLLFWSCFSCSTLTLGEGRFFLSYSFLAVFGCSWASCREGCETDSILPYYFASAGTPHALPQILPTQAYHFLLQYFYCYPTIETIVRHLFEVRWLMALIALQVLWVNWQYLISCVFSMLL